MTPMQRVAEARQRLWIVLAPLVVWGVHFMACYITAALYCGPAVPGDRPSLPPTLFVVYTAVAGAAILACGWIGWKAHSLGDAETPHDADSPEDRHRFLGLATLLFAGLSFVAVVYTAMAVFMVQTCQ
jgi:hypothetical protein